MKRKVLQLRRPDAEAVRPYDQEPVPALDSVPERSTGLSYQLFETTVPWTPAIASLSGKPTKTGIAPTLNAVVANGGKAVAACRGLLEVPETGEYTFSLTAGGGAVLHLHEGLVIDADRGYQPGTLAKATVRLEQGFHLINLVYARQTQSASSLQLQWSGPGFSLKPIEANRLFHATGKAKGPLY